MDTVETRVLVNRRERLAAAVRPSTGDAAVEARLVMFDGGHAYITDEYEAKVATHLLEPTADQADPELELLPARRLRRGDVLLFLRSSGRDVIREVADKLFLSPGDRDQAGLWRKALLNYRRGKGCSIEAVWTHLQGHGCADASRTDDSDGSAGGKRRQLNRRYVISSSLGSPRAYNEPGIRSARHCLASRNR